MERFILIGAYQDEELLDESKCIDIIYGEENAKHENLEKYIWENHRNNLEEYDLLFLITEDLKVAGRISSSANINHLRIHIEEDGDLSDYSPVYIDIAEWDERVLLSDLLEIDFDEIRNKIY